MRTAGVKNAVAPRHASSERCSGDETFDEIDREVALAAGEAGSKFRPHTLATSRSTA